MNNKNVQQPKQRIIFSFVVFFLLIVFIGIVILFTLRSLQPQVAAAFVVAAGTVVVSVVSVLIAKHYERQAEIQREHMKRKAEIYERQIQFWFGIIFAAKMGKQNPIDQDIMVFFSETLKDLITWGGDDVLRCFQRFRTSIAPSNQIGALKTMLFNFEELLLEMRKELGHNNSGLGKGELLRIFINDYDEALGSNNVTSGQKEN